MSDGDIKYMEEQGIQNALSLALAQVIREQPPNALKRIAQIISPDTFIDPEAVAALRAADAAAAQPTASSSHSPPRSSPPQALALDKAFSRRSRGVLEAFSRRFSAFSKSLDEASALDACLVRQAIAHAMAERMRSESLRESQEGVQRLQAQVRILRETTQALSEEMSVATQRQLAEHSERLNAESAAALEEAIGVVRSQMESTLYAAVAAHERSRVELAGVRATLAERDATLNEIRQELTERRNAMTKLHEACHRHGVVAAANTPVSLAIGAHPGAWSVEAVGSDGAHHGAGAGGAMSAVMSAGVMSAAAVRTWSSAPDDLSTLQVDLRTLQSLGVSSGCSLLVPPSSPVLAPVAAPDVPFEVLAPEKAERIGIAIESAAESARYLEAERIASLAQAELGPRLALAQASKELKLAKMREESMTRVHAEIVARYETERTITLNECEAEREAARKRHEAAREEYEAAREEYEAGREADLAQYEAEREKYEAECTQEREQYEAKLRLLEETTTRSQKALEDELREARLKATGDLSEARARAEDELREARAKAKDELSEARAKAKDELSEARSRAEDELRSARREGSEALRSARRESGTREALLHAELRDLEQELTGYVSVHTQLQRVHEQVVAKLDLAEVELRRAQQRASELTALADAKADAARVADRRAAEAQREAETARSQAQREVEEARSHAADEHEARSHAEAAAEAAFRRVEREVAAAEVAQATAQRTADEIVKTTNEGAAALTEAVEALHQWLDGVLVHGSSNGAAMAAAVAATTRGGVASLALRGANAGLHSLQSRMQHVCDEALRLRREAVHKEEAIARAEVELRAVQEQWATSRRRCEKLETALLKADEKVLEGGAALQKAEAHASASAAAAREAEAASARLEAALEPRRQLVLSLAVQLSDALRRSGSVASDAPMLIDARVATWEWERLAAATSALVSHCVYCWDAKQAELKAEIMRARAQLEAARERVRDKEASLVRVAAVASGMKRVMQVPKPARGPGRTGEQDVLAD
eukprot:jgi/Chrpa1/10423/Chrysochromulina_OHIO_Genome00020627-RA